MGSAREQHLEKLRLAKEEVKTAGTIHKRDLIRQIKRMEKELRIYDWYHAKQA